MAPRVPAHLTTPRQRAYDVLARLDELQRAGTGSNVTLEILVELTKLVMIALEQSEDARAER